MKRANIADLKNRLSHYLRIVRGGESILVTDRNRVVARIEPASDQSGSDADPGWTDELVRNGTLRPPTKRLKSNWLEGRPHVKASVVRALIDERRSDR